MFILDNLQKIMLADYIVVKVYHVLQPSPAGKLWPTLYTWGPLRHTGGTVSNLAYMPKSIGATLLLYCTVS